MSNATRSSKKYGKMIVDSVYASTFQKKGTLTAMLRQDVTTTSWYPNTQVNNSMTNSFYNQDDFDNLPEQEFTSVEHRVAFVNVKPTDTKESVTALVEKFPNAKLYRILSNHPVLTDSQQNAINRGLTSKETIADSKVARYPKGHLKEGQLVLFNGKPQYRSIFLDVVGKDDIDLRTDDPNDYFATNQIHMEMTGEIIEAESVAIEDVAGVETVETAGQTV